MTSGRGASAAATIADRNESKNKKYEIAKGIFMLFISNFHQQNINVNEDIYVENVFLHNKIPWFITLPLLPSFYAQKSSHKICQICK